MEEDWQRDLERWLEPYVKELGNKTQRRMGDHAFDTCPMSHPGPLMSCSKRQSGGRSAGVGEPGAV